MKPWSRIIPLFVQSAKHRGKWNPFPRERFGPHKNFYGCCLKRLHTSKGTPWIRTRTVFSDLCLSLPQIPPHQFSSRPAIFCQQRSGSGRERTWWVLYLQLARLSWTRFPAPWALARQVAVATALFRTGTQQAGRAGSSCGQGSWAAHSWIAGATGGSTRERSQGPLATGGYGGAGGSWSWARLRGSTRTALTMLKR